MGWKKWQSMVKGVKQGQIDRMGGKMWSLWRVL